MVHTMRYAAASHRAFPMHVFYLRTEIRYDSYDSINCNKSLDHLLHRVKELASSGDYGGGELQPFGPVCFKTMDQNSRMLCWCYCSLALF